MDPLPEELETNDEGESFLPDHAALPPSLEIRSDMISYSNGKRISFNERSFQKMETVVSADGFNAKDLEKEAIHKLMDLTGFDNGKWVIKPQEKEVDEAWKRTKNLLDEIDHLSAKVSTIKGSTEFDEHVICVYGVSSDPDYVRQLGNCLESQGLDTEGFKPDAYTMLGIEPGNLEEYGFDSEYRFE